MARVAAAAAGQRIAAAVNGGLQEARWKSVVDNSEEIVSLFRAAAEDDFATLNKSAGPSRNSPRRTPPPTRGCRAKASDLNPRHTTPPLPGPLGARVRPRSTREVPDLTPLLDPGGIIPEGRERFRAFCDAVFAANGAQVTGPYGDTLDLLTWAGEYWESCSAEQAALWERLTSS